MDLKFGTFFSYDIFTGIKVAAMASKDKWLLMFFSTTIKLFGTT